uniref:Uncharacterized protein n=1 Tax=Candidatus Methanogaster sp. ANME-2c ERB4 TaxID=2759911 RepID=A0A7G9Y5W2_9EURY|nr:hypothetical protein APENILPF_00019 [Methanosarcinales archaeon ANME-2c ERB4]QNO42041.1 hypothetical protein GKLMMCAD_00019 [Methanosarcinales archaeon ANME-2c ERB4]QNO42661.1 hypothetical protein LNAFDGMD_00022 [Methanosarcinales archaeon ANME-2c ERB4]QNO43396.1 hypothetical protein PNFJDKBC_00007 [Methanosarcinales archaeon ANME-2c ERB4]QNO48234.1 hypothetical protein BHCKGNAA_00019 [Methanosarcinales archaeon ANME-2c ERB4]
MGRRLLVLGEARVVKLRYNVYQIEDKLFDLLGKKKILELPIDCIAVSIFLFVIGIYAISVNGQEIGSCIYMSFGNSYLTDKLN